MNKKPQLLHIVHFSTSVKIPKNGDKPGFRKPWARGWLKGPTEPEAAEISVEKNAQQMGNIGQLLVVQADLPNVDERLEIGEGIKNSTPKPNIIRPLGQVAPIRKCLPRE